MSFQAASASLSALLQVSEDGEYILDLHKSSRPSSEIGEGFQDLRDLDLANLLCKYPNSPLAMKIVENIVNDIPVVDIIPDILRLIDATADIDLIIALMSCSVDKIRTRPTRINGIIIDSRCVYHVNASAVAEFMNSTLDSRDVVIAMMYAIFPKVDMASLYYYQ